VPGRHKAGLLGWAVLTALLPGKAAPTPPLQACRYLVQAVTPAPHRAAAGSIEDRVVWVLELFARLQQQQTLGRGGL
jgi:hypothetical protein